MKRTATTLSLVIPVYNEAKRVSNALRALSKWVVPQEIKLEKIIFVDDGSSDTTIAKIQHGVKTIEKQLHASISIITYPQNCGKGFAVKTGMQESNSDYTLFLDADMSVQLTELKKFLPAMKEGIDVIVGTRKNGHSTVVVHQPKYREVFGKVFTYLSNVILNTWVTDFTCGFKVFSKQAKEKIFSRITANGWSFDSEALFLARRIELSICEIPVIWSDKKGSKVTVWVAAPQSLLELLLIRIRHATAKNTSIGVKYNVALTRLR